MLKSLLSVKQVDDCSNRLQIYSHDEFGFKGREKRSYAAGEYVRVISFLLFHSIHRQPPRRGNLIEWIDF